MSGKAAYDYQEIFARARKAISSGDAKPQIRSLAKALDIPKSTLLSIFKTINVTNVEQLRDWADQETPSECPKSAPTEADAEAVAVFLNKKTVERLDWRQYAQEAIDRQEMVEKLDDSQRIAEIRIDADRPVAILFTGDWHLGDRATNHRQWMDDMEFILTTPDLFMVDLGDSIQNMRSFKVLAGVLEQVLPPRIQAAMLREVVDVLTVKGKLLAKVGGNHDEEFDERIFGQALQSALLEGMKCPYFRNRGLIKLALGNQLYTILAFHKSRFRSILRGAHGAFREFEFSYPADIVAGGHDHMPAFEMMDAYTLAKEAGMPFGGETYLIKVGTYQDGDYGWRYFSNGGKPQNITAVLRPDVHQVRVFPTPQDAVVYMRGLTVQPKEDA